MKAAGYATGMFGKWHLGYEPQFTPLQRGFDEYFGFLGGAHSYLDAAADSHNPILRGTTPVDNIDYTTDAFGREAVAFIHKHKSEPWFVYLPFNAVHHPLESTEKYLARFPNVEDKRRRTFSAMLSAMGYDAVGAVLAELRKDNLEENTLIVFVSDNGGPTHQTTSGNGPLRGFKAQTWEGGIRTPAIVQWKGHLPGGRVDDRPVIQLDYVPTALAAAGIEVQPSWKLDGVNLLPYLNGEKKDRCMPPWYWRFGQQLAIRKGDWKLLKARPARHRRAGSPGRGHYRKVRTFTTWPKTSARRMIWPIRSPRRSKSCPAIGTAGTPSLCHPGGVRIASLDRPRPRPRMPASIAISRTTLLESQLCVSRRYRDAPRGGASEPTGVLAPPFRSPVFHLP